MKIVLDLKLDRQPKENDVIIYQNKQWCVISRESFLSNIVNEQRLLNKSYQEQIEKLQRDLVNLAKIVKEK